MYRFPKREVTLLAMSYSHESISSADSLGLVALLHEEQDYCSLLVEHLHVVWQVFDSWRVVLKVDVAGCRAFKFNLLFDVLYLSINKSQVLMVILTDVAEHSQPLLLLLVLHPMSQQQEKSFDC